MFKLIDDSIPAEKSSAVIKVVGVGGGGSNALEYMIQQHIENVEFICVNTDAQALEGSSAERKIRLGGNLTDGLGAGCRPDVGREAATEDREKLKEALTGADMVFIAAGMGGGTGTGAAPVIAEIARNNNSLTIAVVTKPFNIEGKKRMQVALEGVEYLKQNVDSLITIPNEKLVAILGEVTLLEAFAAANKVLYGAVQGIAELTTRRGLVNLDFADVKTVMSGTGMAMISTGSANGEGRAYEAAQSAINNPLMEDVALSNAGGLLINITSGEDLKLSEYQEIGNCMTALASEGSNIVIGAVVDPSVEDEIRVTLVATGFHSDAVPSQNKQPAIPEPVSIDSSVEDNSATTQDSVEDNDRYDIPAINRRPAAAVSDDNNSSKTNNNEFEDLLDIPSFLRQQVD